jgi:hypothetical protein
MAVEYNGFSPWAIAYAGHAVYQIVADVSPHPHVVTDDG